jgi:hypothetical protein
MERATTLAELLLSDPEILEWLGVDGELSRERLLHPPAELPLRTRSMLAPRGTSRAGLAARPKASASSHGALAAV